MDVLNRPRIRGKYRLTEANIRTVVGLILLRDEGFRSTERINVCRDPKDNKFLEVAVVSRADVVVSEDEDLLVLHPFRGIPLVSPAEFLELLDGTEAGETGEA